MTSTEPRSRPYDADVDYVGFIVSAVDGRAGRVDRDSDEVSPWDLIVRLGFHGRRRKVVLPGAKVGRVDRNGHRLAVALTRAEMRNLPRYDLATYTDPVP